MKRREKETVIYTSTYTHQISSLEYTFIGMRLADHLFASVHCNWPTSRVAHRSG